MVKFLDLTQTEREILVDDINALMSSEGIEQEGINEFWQTLSIGIQAQEIA